MTKTGTAKTPSATATSAPSFPDRRTKCSRSDLEIAIDGDEAVVHATTHIGSEISPAGDRWELVVSTAAG